MRVDIRYVQELGHASLQTMQVLRPGETRQAEGSSTPEAIPRLNRRLEKADIIMQVVRSMNAAEIIHEIETLPEGEKGKVIDFVRHLDERSGKRTRFAGKDSFDKASETVFSKHSKLFEKLAK